MMIRRFARRSLVGCLLAWLSAAGLGCGGPKAPTGKYSGPQGTGLEFVSDQLVKITDPTGHVEADHYFFDGNTITVHSPTGDVNFTVQSDGSITGLNYTFTKAQ
jgi:hypothetical protein